MSWGHNSMGTEGVQYDIRHFQVRANWSRELRWGPLPGGAATSGSARWQSHCAVCFPTGHLNTLAHRDKSPTRPLLCYLPTELRFLPRHRLTDPPTRLTSLLLRELPPKPPQNALLLYSSQTDVLWLYIVYNIQNPGESTFGPATGPDLSDIALSRQTAQKWFRIASVN